MNKTHIYTVISYCSLDKQFLIPCISEALKFSKRIVIVYGDLFLDGRTPDADAESYLKIVANHPWISTIKVKVDLSTNTQRDYHNLFRETGTKALMSQEQIQPNDYILYLDADEILEGTRVATTISNEVLSNSNASGFSFECYWYFREPIYRAVQTEQAGVAYRMDVIRENWSELLRHKQERWAFRDMPHIAVNFIEHVMSQYPICHHYSWARTKNQMIQKVNSWAHSTDRNWLPAIEEEFSRPFNGRDFIHNYQYIQVPNTFNIQLEHETTYTN